MDIFDITASIKLDTSAFESGINSIQSSMSTLASSVQAQAGNISNNVSQALSNISTPTISPVVEQPVVPMADTSNVDNLTANPVDIQQSTVPAPDTSSLISTISQLSQDIGNKLTPVKDTIKNAFRSAIDSAKAILKELPAKASEALQETGEKIKSIADTVSKVALASIGAASTAVVAFGKKAVDAGMSFDTAMSQVAATMGKTVKELEDEVATVTLPSGEEFTGNLRDYAKKMGAETAFSATEAAEALNYMALAGYDAETSMAMLPNVLNLAAAGGMDLALASDMITDTQSALGLSLEETSELVDKMAMASSKSNTSVSQLGEAMLQIGGTAKKLKGGTTELATMLGILADNGMKGAEGGTHLRNIINSLSTPSTKATNLLNNLGVSMYDSEGNMRELNDVFIDLRNAMNGMATEAERNEVLSTIFKVTDLKAAEALIANVGDRYEELSGYIEDAEGAAQGMADTQLDNLQGQITLFKSALEGVYIAINDRLSPTLRDFVKIGQEGLSQLVTAIENGDFAEATRIFEDVLNEGLSMILRLLPTVVKTGGMIVGSLAKGIINNIPVLLDSAIEAVDTFLYSIANSNVDNSNLLTNLTDSIAERLPKIVELARRIITTLANGLSKKIPQMANAVTKLITNLTKEITKSENITEFTKSATKILNALITGLVENLPQIASVATTLVQTFATMIADNMPEIINIGILLLSTLGDIIVENLPLLLDSALQIILALANGIAENLPTIVPAVIGVILSIVETLTNPDNLSALLDASLAIVLALIDGLLSDESLDKLVEEMPIIVENIVTGIVNALPKLLDAAEKIVKKLLEYLSSFDNIKKIIDAGAEIVVTLITGLGSMLYEVGKKAIEITEEIAEKIGLGDYWQVGKDVIDEFMGGVLEKWHEKLHFWEGFGEYIYDALHGTDEWEDFAYNAANVDFDEPHYARGGVITKPTHALIGEAGDEVVMPLENNTGWIGKLAQRIGNLISISRIESSIPAEISDIPTETSVTINGILDMPEIPELSADIKGLLDIPELQSISREAIPARESSKATQIDNINFTINFPEGVSIASDADLRDLSRRMVNYMSEDLATLQISDYRAIGGVSF